MRTPRILGASCCKAPNEARSTTSPEAPSENRLPHSPQSSTITLRGAAISLLPINFMVVAIFSNDPDVSQKSLLVPLMALIYAVAFGLAIGATATVARRTGEKDEAGAAIPVTGLAGAGGGTAASVPM